MATLSETTEMRRMKKAESLSIRKENESGAMSSWSGMNNGWLERIIIEENIMRRTEAVAHKKADDFLAALRPITGRKGSADAPNRIMSEA